MKYALPIAIIALLLTSQSAQAYMKTCSVGQRVEGSGKTGTVVQFDPGHDGQAWCYVDEDNGGKNVAYPAWMLSPSGTNAAHTASLLPGHYECWGQGGGSASATCASAGCVSMHYMYQDINIGAGGAYSDKGGRRGQLTYSAQTKMITFASGPYAGWYSKYLDQGRIGMSAKPTKFWGIVCDRK
ncbi:MAG TPA: hypothetical protein VHL34_07555 [Rhizomicrobium sp.]|jgi:hypothetical protein|nr:hypothetical protein [Rhizomicrobium sp.]